MYAKAIVEFPLSRPKIHRLPASLLPRRDTHGARQVIYGLGFLVALTFLAFATDRLAHRNAAFPETGQETPQTSEAPRSLTSRSQNQTIILTGEKEGIVGQLAKIPAQNQQMSEIKTISEVDNRAGRELLGIISKY